MGVALLVKRGHGNECGLGLGNVPTEAQGGDKQRGLGCTGLPTQATHSSYWEEGCSKWQGRKFYKRTPAKAWEL